MPTCVSRASIRGISTLAGCRAVEGGSPRPGGSEAGNNRISASSSTGPVLRAVSPVSLIAEYLKAMHPESVELGYRFDATRVAPDGAVENIDVSRGQIDFERRHLKTKLKARAPGWFEGQAMSPSRGLSTVPSQAFPTLDSG